MNLLQQHSDTDDDTIVAGRLVEALHAQQPDLQRWAGYYDGTQRLSYLAPELVAELEGRIRPVIVNWPRLVVDSLEERLDVEGFRMGGTPDRRLWGWWQDNDMDEQAQAAHVDALSARRAYVIVGAGDEVGDPPVITVESATQVFAWRDPRTRRVTSAVKTWRADDGNVWATLYLPDRTVQMWGGIRPPSSQWIDGWVPGTEGLVSLPPTLGAAKWEVVDVDDHGLGVVPVVPLTNRTRILDSRGVSELADIVPISDAACKIATDMMVSAEYHAIPRRWMVGMGPEDFRDAEGRPMSKWDRIAGRIWASPNLPSEVAVGQFPEADLRNFHDTLNSLAKMVSAVAGLPPHFLGWSDANPASADAIRSSETRLVKRAERRQRAFGGAWEQVMRLCMLIADGALPAGATRLEAVWRDAATPTVAAKADAVVKLRQQGLVSLRQAREDLGYSPEQIEAMAADDMMAADRILGGDLTSMFTPDTTPAPQDPPVGVAVE